MFKVEIYKDDQYEELLTTVELTDNKSESNDLFFAGVVDALVDANIILKEDKTDVVTLIKANAIGFITEIGIKNFSVKTDKHTKEKEEVTTYSHQFSLAIPVGLAKK